MIKRIAIFSLLICSILILVFTDFGQGQTVIYDCRLSEISPDYPREVKEECRRLRYEQWKQEQEEQMKKKLIIT